MYLLHSDSLIREETTVWSLTRLFDTDGCNHHVLIQRRWVVNGQICIDGHGRRLPEELCCRFSCHLTGISSCDFPPKNYTIIRSQPATTMTIQYTAWLPEISNTFVSHCCVICNGIPEHHSKHKLRLMLRVMFLYTIADYTTLRNRIV